MLKKLRKTLGAVFFIGITLMFLDFTGTLHCWLSWMAKLQFLPAILALNLVPIIIVVALTLLFGRVYCSVICPAGIYQDVVSRIAGNFKKNRFSFSKNHKWLRYIFLGVLILGMLLGINGLVYLLAPYSVYGLMVQNLLQPIYLWFNNLLAVIAEHNDSYAFYTVDIWIKSVSGFVVAIIIFLTFTILAWKGGRTWCNNVCPVGTFLGMLSRFSLYKINIDADKCVNCSLCEKNCKASCIDYKNHTVDYSRCVACMNCISKCNKGAISLSIKNKKSSADNSETNKPDQGLRAMLTTGAVLAVAQTVEAQEKKFDGGLAIIEDKKIPVRETPLKPAGSISLDNFTTRCVGCQLCVTVCPNGVLRPQASLDALERLLQPEMSFERGFCRPECTKCSEVCPTGAITKISREEKTAIKIGHAVWIKSNCIPLTDGVSCGNCARHCPSGAITMVPAESGSSVMIPAVNTQRCIGCGACEYLCPSRPFSAIYVEGNSVHSEM